jgi:hypothetical protein
VAESESASDEVAVTSLSQGDEGESTQHGGHTAPIARGTRSAVQATLRAGGRRIIDTRSL